jgi:hypothetical protein
MTFLADTFLKAPSNEYGTERELTRQIKVFDALSAVALENAINAWLDTLLASPTIYFVGQVQPYSPANNKHCAVVPYGYFL